MDELPNERKNGNKETRAEDKLSPKEILGNSAEKWLARNRSLVLRQTPVWAQSLALIVFTGMSSVAAGIYCIDEVVTVTGQLAAIMEA